MAGRLQATGHRENSNGYKIWIVAAPDLCYSYCQESQYIMRMRRCPQAQGKEEP